MRTKFGNKTLNKGEIAAAKHLRSAENLRQKMLRHNSGTALLNRLGMVGKLGKSYGTDRDLYTAMGYPKTLDFDYFSARFTRQSIAKRVVTAYPDATWREKPEIIEDDDPKVNTDFEEGVVELDKKTNFYHYLNRIDKVSGIGKYGILFLGFDDGKEPDTAVVPSEGMSLLYMQPYSEKNAEIKSLVQDKKDPRFGLPEMYEVSIAETTTTTSTFPRSSGTSKTMNVHHSRVIHVADLLMESDVYGTPRLEPVFNDLQNLELVQAGSAEMFWRGGFPGIALEVEPDAEFDDDALDDEIDAYVNQLTRVLRLQGMKANQLDPNNPAPKETIEAQLMSISGGTGIPQRILTGSERGELASTQDKTNWDSRVDERRKNHAEPMILRRFLDKMIEVGVLPQPEGTEENPGYRVVWPDIAALTDAEKAEIGKNRADAINLYTKNDGADMVVPPETFLKQVLFMEDEEVQQIMEEVEAAFQEEQKLEEERQKIEEEMRQEELLRQSQGDGDE